MQFKLVETDRYWWPVTVRVPDPANPGKVIEQTFRAEFEPMTPEQEQEAAEIIQKLETAREIHAHGLEQVARVIRNWEGVIDAEGNPVPFTTDMLALALKKSWFRIGIQAALKESLSGEEARLGN